MESCREIRDGNGRIWKDYFDDPYNIDTQDHVAVRKCGFDGIQRSNYFGEDIIIIKE